MSLGEMIPTSRPASMINVRPSLQPSGRPSSFVTGSAGPAVDTLSSGQMISLIRVVGRLNRIGRHDLGHGQAGQRLSNQAADFFGPSGAQEEPAEEDRPDSTDQAAGEHEGGQPVSNQEIGEAHADAGRDSGGSQPIASAEPDERLQQPATIQREGWDQVEESERDVDVAQPRQGYGEEAWVGAAAYRHGNEIEHNAQDQAR